jgi:hypothetical protein
VHVLGGVLDGALPRLVVVLQRVARNRLEIVKSVLGLSLIFKALKLIVVISSRKFLSNVLECLVNNGSRESSRNL